MPNDNHPSKTPATPRKPNPRTPAPQLPQIDPPLLNGGPELLRDSNC